MIDTFYDFDENILFLDSISVLNLEDFIFVLKINDLLMNLYYFNCILGNYRFLH